MQLNLRSLDTPTPHTSMMDDPSYIPNLRRVTFVSRSDKYSEGSSHFIAETIRSLGQPMEEFEDLESSGSSEDAGPEEVPMNDLSCAPQQSVVDPGTMLVMPRSSQSFDEHAQGITISPALIDGPDGPMLYNEWLRRRAEP